MEIIMSKKITIGQIADFVEMNTDYYACSGFLTESIVKYAEYAVRKKYEDDDHDEEAGLLMAACLNLAFIYSLSPSGKSFLSYVKKEGLLASDLEGLIIYLAVKRAKAEYRLKPDEETEYLMDALDATVRVYIQKIDSKEVNVSEEEK